MPVDLPVRVPKLACPEAGGITKMEHCLAFCILCMIPGGCKRTLFLVEKCIEIRIACSRLFLLSPPSISTFLLTRGARP